MYASLSTRARAPIPLRLSSIIRINPEHLHSSYCPLTNEALGMITRSQDASRACDLVANPVAVDHWLPPWGRRILELEAIL